MNVSVAAFTNYKESIFNVLEDLDFKAVINSSTRFLIKPNCINTSPPPVTTPVACCEAIIAYIRSLNQEVEVVIGEGCGDNSRETFDVFKALGYDRFARKFHIELIDLNTAPLKKLSRPDCHIFPEIFLPEIIFDHYVISVPVLKAHSLATITGALKNMMGAAPPKYYGGSWKKSFFHNRMQQSIIELNKYRMPDLAVVDGSVGLANFHLGGPCCHPPVKKIFAGYDAIEVDQMCARLLGFEVEDIEHIQPIHYDKRA